MPRSPDKIPEKLSLRCTEGPLKDNPEIGAREVSECITAFMKAVRERLGSGGSVGAL
jgi:hypothetical protein